MPDTENDEQTETETKTENEKTFDELREEVFEENKEAYRTMGQV